MHTTPVLSFKAEKPDNKTLEADVALFWQDSIFGERNDGILFAECKTYDRFKPKILIACVNWRGPSLELYWHSARYANP